MVCVSRFTRDALLARLPLTNVAVIHNGHDASPDGPTERDRVVVDGRPLILGVGALKPRKGYHVALRAVAALRQRFPQLRYYLVGDVSDRAYVDRLRRDIAELGIEQQAVITGPVSDSRLRAFYRQADLFLLTPVNSGQTFEGFGIAYLEANGCNVVQGFHLYPPLEADKIPALVGAEALEPDAIPSMYDRATG